MKLIRLLASSVLIVLLVSPQFSAAQRYPEKPVRIILPFPSGPAPILGHLIADRLTQALGQGFVADHRPGAGGIIGTEAAVRSPPDGYTLLLLGPALVISPSLYRNLKYDPLKDLAPITLVASVPNVLIVHPSLPVKTLKELVQFAKAHPGKLSYGSGGIGSANQLAGELFKSLAGVDIVHVPYKGASIALIHILIGEVEMVVVTLPATIPFITSGKLRALAVLAPERAATMPSIPTTAEAGMPELVIDTWYGVLAPAATKPDIIERLNAEITRIMKLPDVKQQLAKVGADPVTSTPAQFAELLKADTAKWARVIKDANIRVE